MLWTEQRAIGRALVTGGSLTTVTAQPAAASEAKPRRPGFVVDATARLLSRLELPSWLPPSIPHSFGR